MIRVLPQVVFAVVMILMGIVAVLFPSEIRAAVLRVVGESRGIPPLSQAIWSIRFSGVVATLIGAFVLWMSWRN